MNDYNKAWKVLLSTVNRMDGRTDLTPEQVTECCDTIIRAATIMSREIDRWFEDKVMAMRTNQLTNKHAEAD